MRHRYGRAALIGVALGALLHEANKPRSLATVPNTEGFRFTGHKLDGTRVQCIVRKDAEGLYRSETLDGRRNYAELTAWSPAEL